MRLRKRSVSGTAAWLVVGLLLSLMLYPVAVLIQRSLDEQSSLRAWLSNNLIADLVGGFLLSAVFCLWKHRHGFVFHLPVFGDNRQTLSPEEICQAFDADATCRKLPEGGWEMYGNGTNSRSTVRYKSEISTLVTATAQFCPIVKNPQSKYWRCGLVFCRPGDAEAVCVHIDSHNLLVGYLDGAVHLKVTVPKALEKQFSVVSLQLSECDDRSFWRVFAQVDGLVYFVGRVKIEPWPWSLHIRSWSDEKKYHHVRVRDLSVDKVLA